MPLSNPDNKVIFLQTFCVQNQLNWPPCQHLSGAWGRLKVTEIQRQHTSVFIAALSISEDVNDQLLFRYKKVANTSRVWRGNKVAINQVGDRSAHFSLRVETCSNCKYNLCQGRSQGHQPPLMDSCGCTIFNTAYWSFLKTRWYYFQK